MILALATAAPSLSCVDMNLEDLMKLARLLEGEVVSFKTLAANSLSINFNGPPGSPDLWTLWLEPPWRCECTENIIVGSDDLPYPDDDVTENERKAQFDEFCRLSDPIVGAEVDQIAIDPLSHDLTLTLANGQVVRTFACGHEDESWRLISEVQRVLVFPNRIEVERLKAMN